MYLLCLIIACFIPLSCQELTKVLDQCKYKVEPMGCFTDNVNDRAIPEEIINERDTSSRVYNDRLIDWNNYHTYLQGFICRCAEKSFKRGFKVIAIQFYAECYSGPAAHINYKRHGNSVQCKNGKYEHCGNSSNVCTGTDSTNFLYRIAPTDCDVNYEPVSCSRDSQKVPRPLPEYLMNERDYTISNWNNHLIDWKNWNTYSPKMICRCAKRVQQAGFKYFGIQFYGECWSGSNDKVNVSRDGDVNTCIAEGFDTCPYNSYHCVGQEFTNRIYRLN